MRNEEHFWLGGLLSMPLHITINHYKRFIAVFSPKCGSTTLRNWFEHTLDSEDPAINAHDHMIPLELVSAYPHYRKVFFIRNPFRRLVSFFCYWVIRNNTDWCYADAQQHFQLQNTSFREFVHILWYLWSKKLRFQHHLESQCQGLEEISFDCVVTLETFDSKIESLNKVLEVDYVPQRMKVTPYNTLIKEDVSERHPAWFRRVGIPSCEFFYNEELINLVCGLFEQDVAFYFKHYPVVKDDFDKWLIQRVPQATKLQTEATIRLEPLKIDAEPVEKIPSHSIQIDNFLPPDEANRLLAFALTQDGAWEASTETKKTPEYRKAMVMKSFEKSEFAELMADRVRAHLPDLLHELNFPSFPVQGIESELTASNDGDFIRIHRDRGAIGAVQGRELTYVYHFYREPRPFIGGELVLYDGKIENNTYKKADSCTVVEPRHNSIVFFLSGCLYKILPICCLSQAFQDSRFTVSGWIHRQRMLPPTQLPGTIREWAKTLR